MEEIKAERARFAKVIAARKTNREILELFERLGVSDKFSAEAKPYCYADLIAAGVKRIANRQVMDLLEAVEESGAARAVRAVLGPQEADVALRSLVKRAFESSPQEEGALMEAFARLENSGVSADRGHTLDMALQAGMTTDQLDPICDLTFYAYYPTLRRPALAA